MKPAIVMQTDFTVQTPAVCTMYGVCQMIDPTLRIFDNTHDIPNFDTYQASDALIQIVDFWAPGTVFVSVVDPTVGTDRKACVAKLSNGSFVVTPDNGSLTHVKKYFGIDEVRTIDETRNRLESTKRVSIFHGRDLFAYCAGKLAAGIITYEEVGPLYPVETIIEHKIIEPSIDGSKISGMIETIDPHFGLVASNIPSKIFTAHGIQDGDTVLVQITHKNTSVYEQNVTVQPSFGYVAIGQAVVVVSENSKMQIAINQGHFKDTYGIDCGPDWLITFEKTS